MGEQISPECKICKSYNHKEYVCWDCNSKEVERLRKLVRMHDNKKRKVLETFRGAKEKRDLLLDLFDRFTLENGIYDIWIQWKINNPIRKKYIEINKKITKQMRMNNEDISKNG